MHDRKEEDFMTAKERILAIKLMADEKKHPEYIKHLGIESKIAKTEKRKNK